MIRINDCQEEDSLGRLGYDTNRGTERDPLFNRFEELQPEGRPASILEEAANHRSIEVPARVALPRVVSAKSRFINEVDDRFLNNGTAMGSIEGGTTVVGAADCDPDLPSAGLLP